MSAAEWTIKFKKGGPVVSHQTSYPNKDAVIAAARKLEQTNPGTEIVSIQCGNIVVSWRDVLDAEGEGNVH